MQFLGTESFNTVLSLFIPYLASNPDNYTRDKKALLKPPTAYQRNLNTSKKKEKKDVGGNGNKQF